MKSSAKGRDVYSLKHFHRLLKAEYKDKLEFVSRQGTKDILCFKSSINEIITEYHKDHEKDNGVDPKLKLISAAVKLIKDEAKCTQFGSTCFYPSVIDMGANDLAVSQTLLWLMEGLISNKTKADVWAQFLMRQICPRAPISPFMIGLALEEEVQQEETKRVTCHHRDCCLIRRIPGLPLGLVKASALPARDLRCDPLYQRSVCRRQLGPRSDLASENHICSCDGNHHSSCRSIKASNRDPAH